MSTTIFCFVFWNGYPEGSDGSCQHFKVCHLFLKTKTKKRLLSYQSWLRTKHSGPAFGFWVKQVVLHGCGCFIIFATLCFTVFENRVSVFGGILDHTTWAIYTGKNFQAECERVHLHLAVPGWKQAVLDLAPKWGWPRLGVCVMCTLSAVWNTQL